MRVLAVAQRAGGGLESLKSEEQARGKSQGIVSTGALWGLPSQELEVSGDPGHLRS